MSPLSRRSALRLGGMSVSTALSGCSALSRIGSKQIDWTTTVGDDDIFSPPAVGDGLVHVGVSESDIVALDSDSGEVEWRRFGNGLMAVPVLSNGRLVSRTRWGDLLCLDAASGAVEWEQAIPSDSGVIPPPVIENETVYIATSKDVRALSMTDGEVRWRQPFARGQSTEGDDLLATGRPVLSDGVLYLKAGPPGGDFSALDAESGEVLWTAKTDTQEVTYSMRYSPAVDSRHVFVGTEGGTLHAFDRETGDETFTIKTEGPTTSPTIAEDRLLFGSGPASAESTLHAVDPTDGSDEWSVSVYGTQWYASPTVSDGIVYVGHWADTGSDKPPRVVGFNARTGTEMGSVSVEGNVSAKLTVENRHVYVPAGNRLSAVNVTSFQD